MFYLTLILIEIPLFINFFADGRSGSLHLLSWLLAVILTLISLEFGVVFAVLTLGWWEIPLLRLGYPNQFLSDIVVLGLMAGSLGHRKCRDVFNPGDFGWIHHPIALALFLITPLAVGQLLASLYELQSLSATGLGFRRFIVSVAARLYDWDIERDFLHRFSAVNAFIVHLVVAIFFTTCIKHGLLSQRVVLRAFILGVHGIAAYAALQIMGIMPVVYTVDIGGTLQNGNLLSFMGALALFAEIHLTIQAGSRVGPKQIMMTLLSCTACMFAMIAGVGRISWLSSALAAMLFIPIGIKKFKMRRDFLSIRLLVPTLLFFGLGALITYGLRNLGSMSAASAELIGILKDPSLMKIISAGARMGQFSAAWRLWQENLLSGIGLDAFYIKGGVGLDIHNFALKWGTEMGLVGFLIGCLAILNASIVIARVWWRNDLKNISIAALAVVALVPALGDSTMNYKSMLLASSLCTIPLAVIYDPIKSPIVTYSRKAKFLIGTFLVTLFFMLGLATLTNPQSLVRYVGNYGAETDLTSPTKLNSWRPLATVLAIKGDQSCYEFSIKPLIRSHEYRFRVTSLTANDSRPPDFSTLVALNNYEQSFGERLKTFETLGGEWRRVCVCIKNVGQANALYLRSYRGEVIALSKADLGVDYRFVGFGLDGEPVRIKDPEFGESCIRL